MEKVLICIPNRSNYVMAWALEYALNLSGYGAFVTIVDFSKLSSRYIKSPERWWTDNLSYSRRSRRTTFLRKFCKKNSISLVRLKSKEIVKCAKQMTFEKEHEDLRNVFETALRSSYARWFGSSDITVADVPIDLVLAEEISFKAGFIAAKELILDGNFDLIVTINGRFILDSAVVASALKSQVRYGLLEKFSEGWEYYNVFQISAQSIYERNQLIQREWQDPKKGSELEKAQVAREYLEFRLSDEWPWTKGSRRNPLETINLPRGKIVSVFLTSDFEFPVYSSQLDDMTMSQTEAVKIISQICNELGLSLVLRGHPHPSNPELSLKEDLKFAQIAKDLSAIYVACDSGIDSLELARISYANFVHGSSLAVDLIAKGISVRSTNVSEYIDFVHGLKTFDRESIRRYLLAPSIVGDIENLLPWAFAVKCGGIRMRHFWISDHAVLYNGRQIEKEYSLVMSIRKKYAESRGRQGDGPKLAPTRIELQ